jgi:hypothetical protein
MTRGPCLGIGTEGGVHQASHRDQACMSASVFSLWLKRRHQGFVAFVPWTVDGEAIQAWQPIGCCVAIAMGT